MRAKASKAQAWISGAILGPIVLGVLAFFWATYVDLVNIKASEQSRDERIDRIEKQYDKSFERMESKIDGIFDRLVGARERQALDEEFGKPKQR